MGKGKQEEKCQLSPLSRDLSQPFTFLTPEHPSRIPKTCNSGFALPATGSMAFFTSPPTSRCQGLYPGTQPGTPQAQLKYSSSIKQVKMEPRKARMQMLQSYSALRKCHPPSRDCGRGPSSKVPCSLGDH